MLPQNQKIVQLQNNPVKQYAWGYSTANCYVGKLSNKKQLNNYAELWMGVHCNGQSQVRQDNNNNNIHHIKLSQFLIKNNYSQLQHLFKVLSIQKCLSIQVHPNKQQAVKLHKQQPKIYQDDNDKPQMFYTLTQFQLFLGYVKPAQFNRLIGLQIFNQILKQELIKTPKQAIIKILSLNQATQEILLNKCLENIQIIHPQRYNDKTKKIWKILQDFHNDIGIVISFFLEYHVFQAGICYYIECNTPHAYISGQCLQIMKNSDNVCRLGLTPKYKDLSVIQQVLTSQYREIKHIQPQVNILPGISSSKYYSNNLFFQILGQNKEIGVQKHEFHLKTQKSLKILLILSGSFYIIPQQNKLNSNCVDLQDRKYLNGTVLLLLRNTNYIIRPYKQSRDGLICLGWSEF